MQILLSELLFVAEHLLSSEQHSGYHFEFSSCFGIAAKFCSHILIIFMNKASSSSIIFLTTMFSTPYKLCNTIINVYVLIIGLILFFTSLDVIASASLKLEYAFC